MKLVAAKDGVESGRGGVNGVHADPKPSARRDDSIPVTVSLKKGNSVNHVVKSTGGLKHIGDDSNPNSFVTAHSLLSSPTDNKNALGDIPPVPQASSTPQASIIPPVPQVSSTPQASIFQASFDPPPASVTPASVTNPQAHVENLGLALKQEMMDRASSSSSNSRNSVIALTRSSDDEDDFDLSPSKSRTTTNKPKLGNHQAIYGYTYAVKYIWSAHFGKNGPHTHEKVYDKEFVTNLMISIDRRNNLGPKGYEDSSLLCNQLNIYGVHSMTNKTNNSVKRIMYSHGGTGHISVFTRVFTKKDIKNGLNNEQEMMRWLEAIRVAYVSTKAMYELRLDMGGILGKHQAHARPLDTYLLDYVVADYAKLFYRKKVEDGTMLSDTSRVSQFFSPWNAEAAKDLLG